MQAGQKPMIGLGSECPMQWCSQVQMNLPWYQYKCLPFANELVAWIVFFATKSNFDINFELPFGQCGDRQNENSTKLPNVFFKSSTRISDPQSGWVVCDPRRFCLLENMLFSVTFQTFRVREHSEDSRRAESIHRCAPPTGIPHVSGFRCARGRMVGAGDTSGWGVVRSG